MVATSTPTIPRRAAAEQGACARPGVGPHHVFLNSDDGGPILATASECRDEHLIARMTGPCSSERVFGHEHETDVWSLPPPARPAARPPSEGGLASVTC